MAIDWNAITILQVASLNLMPMGRMIIRPYKGKPPKLQRYHDIPGSFYYPKTAIIWGMDTQEIGQSLQAAFAAVPDFRAASGRRHPLPAILTLAVCAMLSGAGSLYAIPQWGRCQDAATISALGFIHPRTPAVSCWHRVLRGLDVAAFETAIAQWVQQHLALQVGGGVALAVDGKALRGIHGAELPGVRLVAGYAHGAGLVAGQRGGGARSGGTDDGP